MTMFARRSDHFRDAIEVHVTHGPVEVQVTEHVDHLRHFWHDLGELLGAVEHAAFHRDEQAGDEDPTPPGD